MKTDATDKLLLKMMDLASVRQRVLMHNLANVNTPGFKRQDLPFQEELSAALNDSSGSSAEPRIVTDAISPSRLDGNNVQLEVELAEMQKNALLYQMVIQIKGIRGSIKRMAIAGRSM